jgi:hypothetical protein
MRFPNIFLPPLPALLLGLALFPSPVQSDCGLHALPAIRMENRPALEVGAGYDQVLFDIDDTSGSYSEFIPEIAYAVRPDLVIGLQWPYLILQTPGSRKMGLANPMVFTEYRHSAGPGQSISLGLQLEAPLGDAEDGLAMDRFMAVNYGTWNIYKGRFFGGGTLGSSLMLPWMEPHRVMDMGGMNMPGMDHAHMMEEAMGSVFVHPHENWEVLYRIVTGMTLWNGKLSPTFALGGQHVLSETMRANAGTDFASLEFALPIRLGRSTLEPALKRPVSPSKRFEWNFGLTARVSL